MEVLNLSLTMALLMLLAMLFVFHLFYKIAVSYTPKCVTEASDKIILSSM